VDRIRVLIADDEQIVRESLAGVIGSDPSLEIVGSAEDAQGAIDLAAWRLPDVALLDVRMPGGGPRAAAEIARLSPSTRVLALSAAEDRESVLNMIRAGALSYVGKTASNEEILNAIHGTAEGGTQLSAKAVNGVFEAIADTGEGDGSSDGNGSPLGSDPREQIERIIERRAVELAYQPLADLATLRIVAVEALPRFRTRPMRSPESWLVEAAKHGWLIDLELVALNAAFGHVGMLLTEAFLAVCISPETALSGRFRDLIRGVDQSRIALELNEESADQLPTGALDELRANGVRVAIQHARAGPRSLRHIVRLAPDLIKVDMSILRAMAADPTGHEPLSSFIGLAFDIGAMVVADGVETEQEVETLRRLGIDHAQGNYLARPGPIPKGGGTWGRTTLSADPTAIAT
jgi:EAL domain-containing protein (putative c-di-GMP-specific phosphodiesterase class I)/DNA-binding NarL/FixJ family response regulator